LKLKGISYGDINLDVNAKGNTSNIDHLLRKRLGGSGNHSQLEFEVGLRGYNPKSGIKHNSQWSNVLKSNSRNSALNNYKTEDGRKTLDPGSDNLRQSKFTDKYTEKNLNLLREINKPGKNLRNLIWEVGLRGDS